MNKFSQVGGSASQNKPDEQHERRNEQMEKRVRRLQEDILGNEALGGDSLDQKAASELLSWGLSGATVIAADTEGMDDEAADMTIADRLKAMRKLMRHLGRLLGEGKTMSAEDRAWFWSSVQKQAVALYGDGLEFPALEDVMGRLDMGESPQQIIASLRSMFEKKS